MSAVVSVEAWGWYCYECNEGSELTFDSEHLAQKDAAEHDREYHSNQDGVK